MKKRWMTSVIEGSKKATPALPYHRTARQMRAAASPAKVRILKTA